MTTKPQKYLTTEQVADLLQVKEDTVRLWLRDGVLKGFRIGRRWRIPPEAVEALELCPPG